MDIYVARQPIFNRYMGLYGYELLYRKSSDNYYEGLDQNDATAELVHNSFLVMNFDQITDGTRGFINFTQDLLENETPRILPKEKVVIEILENVRACDSVIMKCRKLKSDGYTIALDDFIFNRDDDDYTPLIELADIIKIEYPATDKREQRKLIDKYKGRITFLAEKVETREEYKEALEMGYELFQGYFFCRPTIVKAKEIGSLNIHLVKVLEELRKEDPSFTLISEIIQKDLGLSYKLLKISNSIYFGGKYTIHSLREAVVRLGIEELKRWVSIMLIKESASSENYELIKACLLRGRLLSLMAKEMDQEQMETDFFLTGILSSIDVILNDSMENIVGSLALSREAQGALLGERGRLRDCLDCILVYEKFEFEGVRSRLAAMNISLKRFVDLYMEALTWLKTTDD